MEFLQTLQGCFADLKDPRGQASCDHLLIDILAITILAMTCGANDWTDLETFGNLRQKWLKTFLALPQGIPAQDTFRRVFGLLDRKQFAAGLFGWTQAIHEATDGKRIAIDGKALWRSFARKSGKVMRHLVTAWSSENGLRLGQVACEEKSNEITAIPETSSQVGRQAYPVDCWRIAKHGGRGAVPLQDCGRGLFSGAIHSSEKYRIRGSQPNEGQSESASRNCYRGGTGNWKVDCRSVRCQWRAGCLHGH